MGNEIEMIPQYWQYGRFRYKSVALRLDGRSKDDVPPVPHVKVQQHESQNISAILRKKQFLKKCQEYLLFL